MNLASTLVLVMVAMLIVVIWRSRALAESYTHPPATILSPTTERIESGARRQCRTAIFMHRSFVNWPLAKVGVATGRLLIESRGATFLRYLPVPSSIPRASALAAEDVISVRRAGLVLQWGVLLEVDRGFVGLWGPKVLSTLRLVGELPAVARDPRRLVWLRDVWSAAPQS